MSVKVFLTLGFLVSCMASFGQGTILFNNRIGAVDAPVRRPDGTGPGAGASAGLFLVEQGVYTPLFPTTVFRTTSPAAAFYIVQPGANVVVPGHDVGSIVTVVMRTWDGPTYESSFWFGESNPVTLMLGGTPQDGSPPLPPALLIGLQNYVLVPEPSMAALALVGAAALLFRKRRN